MTGYGLSRIIMEQEIASLIDRDHEQKKSLPLYRRLAFGTGNFINVLAISMWFPYNISFFQKVIQLSSRSAGTIVLIAQIGGAISTPFIGQWSDNCTCRIPGRRKVFQLIGIISLSCSFFFIWHDCLGCQGVSEPYKVLYYSCFAIVFEFGWAATQVGQLSLIPELTSSKAIQVDLNSIRYAFAIIGNLTIFGIFWGLLEKFNRSVDAADLTSNDKLIFWVIALIVIILGLPVSLIFQIFVPEDPNASPPKLKWYKWLINPRFYLVLGPSDMTAIACGLKHTQTSSGVRILVCIACYTNTGKIRFLARILPVTACGFVAARYIVILPQTYIPLYFINTLGMDKTSIAKGPFILYCSSFVSTLIIKRFNKLIGDKLMYFLGLAAVWGALLWFWVKDPTGDHSSAFNWSRDSIYGANILLGMGGAVVLVMSMAMIAYLVGPYTGSSAFVYGWVAFADRLSNGIAVKIVQQFLPLQQSRLQDYYRYVLIGLPFVGSALGLFTISSMLFIESLQRWKEKRNTNIQ